MSRNTATLHVIYRYFPLSHLRVAVNHRYGHNAAKAQVNRRAWAGTLFIFLTNAESDRYKAFVIIER